MVKLNCRVVGGITGITRAKNNVTGITRYVHPKRSK